MTKRFVSGDQSGNDLIGPLRIDCIIPAGETGSEFVVPRSLITTSDVRTGSALRPYTFKKIFFRHKNQSMVQQISTEPSE
jgi:hypothetical protein